MKADILELYCGSGLVHDGLVSAGLRVWGVDIDPQPRYPGAFLQHDSTTLDERFLDRFRFIWASPPCLGETEMYESARREERDHGQAETAHPDLISPTQRLLDAWAARTGGLFAIENVQNTKRLRNPVTLCGSMFDLGVEDAGIWHQLRRHRKIETNWPLPVPAHVHSKDPVVGVYGGHARRRAASAGGRGTQDVWERGHQGTMQEAMGIHRYMTCEEMSQGVPPAYSCYVATHMLAYANSRRAAA